jgi:hypothetical protein
VVPFPTKDEFEAATVKFQTARDAFMETNPLVKQALLQASESAVRRTAKKKNVTKCLLALQKREEAAKGLVRCWARHHQ